MAFSGIPPPRHGKPTASLTQQSCVTPSGLNVITYIGDIFTVSGADAIVTCEGVLFEQDSYITKTLIERLDGFENKRRELLRRNGPFKLWTVRTTQLNTADHFRVVFHAMLEQGTSDKWVKNMIQLYKQVFRKAEKYQVKTLVLPVLGTGRANADVGDAVNAIVTAVIRCQDTMCLQTVYLTTRDKTIAEMMSTQFQYQFSPLSKEKVKRSKSFLCTSSRTSDYFKGKNPPGKKPRQRSEPNEENEKSNGFNQEQPPSRNFSRRQASPNMDQGYHSGRFSSKERTPLHTETHRREAVKSAAYRTEPKEDYDNINGFQQEQRPSGRVMRPESVGQNDNYYRRNSRRSLEAGEHGSTRRNVDGPAIRDTGNEGREPERSTSRTFPRRHERTNKEQEYSSYRPLVSSRERAPLKQDTYVKADLPRGEHSDADTHRNGSARSEDVTRKADFTRREYNEMTIEVEHGQRVVETSKKERNVPEFNDKQRYEAITSKSSGPYSRHDTNGGFDVRHVTKVDTNRSPAQKTAVPDLEHRTGTKLDSFAAVATGDASDDDDDDDDSHNTDDDAFDPAPAPATAAATGGRDGDSPGKNNVNTFDGQNCPICISPITDPKCLDKCGHVFCRDCIDNSFKHFKPVCPSCNMVYGILTGNQPDGTMDVDFSGHVLPGYKNCGMITVTYQFPDGVQGPNHPHPGQPFDGTARRGFLPDCREGKEVLSLLRTAFDRKLTFTIGRSTTTGKDNVVTWNDIHHKTRIDGGATNFGYPDPGYLARVKGELASKGVTEESTTKQDTTL